jgi:hypothetical protein
MSLLRRIAPALLLVMLAPIVAEFLLGDFSVRMLPFLLVLLPQYGGGALLIREVTRRTGRGWPTMLLLAVAYALVEEGFTTQSLFNPNYLGLRLLDYGYVAALGISTTWTVFVLSIHVVWSIGTPILIAEGVAADRRTTPWLGRPGLIVAAALFGLGCALTTAFTVGGNHFVAPLPQFLVTAVLVVAAIAAAFAPFRPGSAAGEGAPPPWLVGAATLVLATAFELVEHLAQGRGAPAAVTALALLACELIAVVLIWTWSRRRGWGAGHYLAIAAGTVLTYAWVGLSAFLRGRTNVGAPAGAADVIGQVVLALLILGLIGWGAVRSRSVASRPSVRVSVRVSAG